MRRTVLLTILLVCAIMCPVKGGTIHVVPWDTGCGTIQDAIDLSVDGDEVLVDSSFSPFSGVGNRDIDTKGLDIIIWSSHGAESTTIDCGGSPYRGFYFHSGEDANTIIDGFTITNGSVADYGGGIYCESSSPTIKNCIITGNEAANLNFDTYGGGIYCWDSSPAITGCTISDNTAEFGGGVYCEDSSLTISLSVIKDNFAESDLGDFGGGGVYCSFSSPTIEECTISYNTTIAAGGTYGYGGGVECVEGSSAVIRNCTIAGNSADYGGGVDCYDPCSLQVIDCAISNNSAWVSGGGVHLQNFNSYGLLDNCTISGNSAERYGGGIECADVNSTVGIRSCIISGNFTNLAFVVVAGGGAIDCFGSSPAISNCTINSNTVLGEDGVGGGINCETDIESGIYPIPSQPVITNCIFTENNKHAIYETSFDSDPNVRYCLFYDNNDGDYWDCGTGSQTGEPNINGIPDGYTGNNIADDPLFVMDGPNSITGTWKLAPVYDTDTKRTTLTDTDANFVEDELIGWHINADITQAWHVLITANTSTTIEVIGDVTGYVEQTDTYKILDYHLRNDSNCIDAGDPDFPVDSNEVDIDGQPRLVGERIDLGADEVYYGPIVTFPTDFNNDWKVDFRDYAILAGAWLSEQGQPGWEPDCDLYDDGVINYEDMNLFLIDWLYEGSG